jgi:hypothetical protein
MKSNQSSLPAQLKYKNTNTKNETAPTRRAIGCAKEDNAQEYDQSVSGNGL